MSADPQIFPTFDDLLAPMLVFGAILLLAVAVSTIAMVRWWRRWHHVPEHREWHLTVDRRPAEEGQPPLPGTRR
jgi:hypothetical protein